MTRSAGSDGESPPVKSLGSCLGFFKFKSLRPLRPDNLWGSFPNTQTYWRVPKFVLVESPKYETGKVNGCVCCLSCIKPNKQRQGLNLYGHLIQVASDLRRWWIRTQKRTILYFLSRPTFYNKE